jgi:peptidyl-prolyl cis-trans isomerase B (cyclophilin B)
VCIRQCRRSCHRRTAVGASIAIVATPALLAISSASSKVREAEAEVAAAVTSCLAELPVTVKAFLDVSIGGESAGRITVGLFGGATRFLSLVTGMGYRRKEFMKVVPGYVQHGGVVSYSAVPAVTERLAAEAEAVRTRCGAEAAERSNRELFQLKPGLIK